MRMGSIAGAGLVLVLAGGLAAATSDVSDPVGAPGDAAAQESGEQIFKKTGNCFACHGMDGTGTAVAPDLTDDAWVNFEERPTEDEVIELVKTGVPEPMEHPAPMPPMGGASLDDEQVAAVAAYVLSLSAGGG